MEVPTISVVLPTFNREEFLTEAFESIAAQTFADWELIVVDDGSTDGTSALVGQLARRVAQPVTYLYQPNRGPGAARNLGIQRARGQYLAFLDSDDLWLPHHLARCA